MKSIVVGFSKSKKKFALGSLLIRLYQWTKFSHTYIRLLVGNRFPSDKILHASEGLVQNMSGTQFDKKHEVIVEYEITIPDIIVKDKLKNTQSTLYSALISIMHETAGDNYGMMQNIGILYVDFMKKFFNKTVKNPWSKGWNCSEFVASILALIYPKEFGKLDPNTITPKQVEQILDRLDKDESYSIWRRKIS